MLVRLEKLTDLISPGFSKELNAAVRAKRDADKAARSETEERD